MPITRTTTIAACFWLLLWFDATVTRRIPTPILWVAFAIIAAAALAYALRHQTQRKTAATLAFIPICHSLYFSATQLRWQTAASLIHNFGIAAIFLIGLGWIIYYVDIRSRALELQSADGTASAPGWNPLDLQSKLYRRRSRRLDQSLAAFLTYGAGFYLLFILLTRLPGCDISELPLGGGKPKPVQVVRLQKVIEKKFVINPYSVVKFNPPPIEKIQLQLLEASKHAYEVGYGEDKGAGFAAGTASGEVDFIRLQYDGGDWDQDLANESDLNMLTEYHVRTGHRCAKQPQIKSIAQVGSMPAHKTYPFLYLTGQGNLITSKREQEILRELVTERRCMLFADNGGSGGWHQQFFDLMRRVLPNIEPVRVPLDHPIHRLHYDIPFLPYVAPHGGKDAWGWVIEGRLAAYYHPGDIGDAWGNGHAGVRREIWEYCYQLGVNAMLYAHAEKNKWLTSLAKQNDQK